MNVGITTLWYGSGRGGGAEEVVRRIASGLKARGHSVTVLTSFEGGSDDEDAGDILRFPISGRLGYTCFGVTGPVGMFLDHVNNANYNCVIVYAAQTWQCDVLLDAKARGVVRVPIVLVTCGFSGLIGHRRPFYLWYFERMAKLLHYVDRIVCHDRNYIDFEFCVDAGLTPTVIPNGVDRVIERSDGFRKERDLVGRKIILNVGHHYSNKGHSSFFDVIEGLADPTVVGVLIGGDPRRVLRSCWRMCQRRAMALKGRVLILGSLDRAGVYQAFASADMFLFPSRVEAAPLVLIESMAAGVPFVSFDVGNARFLHGGVTCTDTAKMIAITANILGSDSECRRLGIAGRTQVQQTFLWSAVIDQYERLLFGL